MNSTFSNFSGYWPLCRRHCSYRTCIWPDFHIPIQNTQGLQACTYLHIWYLVIFPRNFTPHLLPAHMSYLQHNCSTLPTHLGF